MASMSFYQSVHMLGTHVVFLSEWMGGSSVRILSGIIQRSPGVLVQVLSNHVRIIFRTI